MKFWAIVIISVINCCGSILADTPANCTFEDVKGFWIFSETEPIKDRNENCDNVEPADLTRKLHINLDYPNVASDSNGNIGTWTMIYNQGFEVIINYRKYFAFSLYKKKGTKVTSFCHQTSPGWSHDVLGNSWACFKAEKTNGWNGSAMLADPKSHTKEHELTPLYLERVDKSLEATKKLVEQINTRQNSWKAAIHPHLVSKNLEEIIAMSGGPASRLPSRPKPIEPSEEIRKLARTLPESFDWRDVNGVNYVSPVRNQLQCGSCYIFASMAMLEARVRIATNNTRKPVFSTQNVLSCSNYSQGCSGGFPYLIGGKYAQDYGVVEESCDPYKYPWDGQICKTQFNSTECNKRTYTIDYQYIGGYYGACSEEAMRVELVQNGPIAVGFEVYRDLVNYKNGVYSHSSNELLQNNPFNPFEMTNHAVLAVGYGVDKKSGKKYWIIKNSWGTGWGMDGYFWIQRGNDECGVESLAVKATPIPV